MEPYPIRHVEERVAHKRAVPASRRRSNAEGLEDDDSTDSAQTVRQLAVGLQAEPSIPAAYREEGIPTNGHVRTPKVRPSTIRAVDSIEQRDETPRQQPALPIGAYELEVSP